LELQVEKLNVFKGNLLMQISCDFCRFSSLPLCLIYFLACSVYDFEINMQRNKKEKKKMRIRRKQMSH
jgi:hypothetical protein